MRQVELNIKLYSFLVYSSIPPGGSGKFESKKYSLEGKFSDAVFEIIVKLLIFPLKTCTSFQKSGVYLVFTSFGELIPQRIIFLLLSLFVIRYLNQT